MSSSSAKRRKTDPADVVKRYELFKVPPRWLFLRIETEKGIVGWGEPNLEGFSDTIAAAVREMMDSVVGEAGIFVSTTGNFKIIRLEHMKAMKKSRSCYQKNWMRIGPHGRLMGDMGIWGNGFPPWPA